MYVNQHENKNSHSNNSNTRTSCVLQRLASGQDDRLASAFLPYEGTMLSAPRLANMVILDTPSWDILHVCAQAVLI